MPAHLYIIQVDVSVLRSDGSGGKANVKSRIVIGIYQAVQIQVKIVRVKGKISQAPLVVCPIRRP